jgi:hydroxymethylpyrimidine pyrophosphatase-like HAD family hydrolase
MRFRVLACDYDRTLATRGTASPQALDAIRAVRASGRRLVLVTGRTLEELLNVFSELRVFDTIVVENGAVVTDPATGIERALAEPIPGSLVDALRDRGVQPLILGRVICSTRATNLEEVQAAARDLGLDVQSVVNRDSVMVLPAGITKATGLIAALRAFGEPLAATVTVGDGENDVPLIDAAGVGVAVADAVDELKKRADIVLERVNGEGIEDLCAALVDDDLASLLPGAQQRAAG